MSTWQDKVTIASSVLLRLVSYLFLRWVPGHQMVIIIFTLFAIYLPSFVTSFLTQPQYDVVDQIDIAVQPPVEVFDHDRTGQVPSAAAQAHNLRSADKPTHLEQEVDIEETLTVQEKPTRFWRTLLTGAPSPTSALLSLLTLLINVGLVAMTADFVYRGKMLYPSDDVSFARLGYVSDSQAKLLIREPDTSKLPIFVSLRIHNPQPPTDFPGWHNVATLTNLTNATDYTGVVEIPLPNYYEKTYQYVTSNNHTGFFTSAPKAGKTTALNDGKFTFLTTSCIKPHWPYTPWEHPLGIPGFRSLAKVLPSLKAQFMLFLGDFIYIDVPHRFGDSIEDYRREYRKIYASPDWHDVSQNLSWIHVIDDHEIANDWDLKETGVYNTAIEPYNHYHLAANPPPARKAGTYNTPQRNASYFEFTNGPASFFMMDTRRYRDQSGDLPHNSTEKSMLGATQLADLLSYLERPEPAGVHWKFVISSVPFTKNWRVNGNDTWGGYLHERQRILEAMWDVGARGSVGVVVLSGDRHEFAATAFPPPVGGKWPVSATVNEFSTSPLNQFYVPVRTYRQTDNEDVMVKYLPDGNSKFGAITIETPEASDQSILRFRLFVDGKESWSSVLLSPPKGGGSPWTRDAKWG